MRERRRRFAEDPGVRRMRVHRLELRPSSPADAEGPPGRQPGQAHVRGEPGEPLRDRRRPAPPVRPRRHLRRGARRAAARRRRGLGRQFRRRDARGPEHPGLGAVHPDQRRRDARAAGGRPQEQGPQVHPGRDGRGLRLARPVGPVHGGLAAPAEQSLFGQQGRRRPARPRLPADLRHGRDDHALHEQLRPVPVPGEGDPGLHRQRAGRTARSRFTATACTCATGCSSRTIAARSRR